MGIKRVEVDQKAKTLTLVMELEEPRPSATGKTMVVATTRGNQATTATIDGKVISVGCNAYYKR